MMNPISVMGRPPKRSTLPYTGARENVDRISGLHTDLLVYLLSFLPTKSAVGTGILSSRWKGLHNLTNRLHFDVPSMNLLIWNGQKLQVQKEQFGIFINTVLIFHKVAIKTFHLNCGGHVYDSSQLRAWINAALSKEVEQLELFLFKGFDELPRGVFNSKTIVELKLCVGNETDLLRVPETVCLPKVKRLRFTRLSFLNENAFQRLFSGCPLLEDLEMHHCYFEANDVFIINSEVLKRLVMTARVPVKVDAPNLVHICYALSHTILSPELSTLLSLKNTDSLVTACLGFSYVKNLKAIRIALRLIKTLNHVKELYLLNNTMEYLSCCKDDDFPSFPNLVKLELGHCSYDAWKHLPFLLCKSPKLDTLVFTEGLIMAKSREEKWPRLIKLFPIPTPVKAIKIYHYHHYATEQTLTKYIVGNARLLRKLVVNGGLMTTMQTLEATEALSTLAKSSPNCDVKFNRYVLSMVNLP